jgi:hypothetical protein
MIEIQVHKPHKTKHEYTFNCSISFTYTGIIPVKRNIKYLLFNRGYNKRNESVFGFKAKNFKIQHSHEWDSIYPLLYLTQTGGPLFGLKDNDAVIRFDYPILKKVKNFFIKRAFDNGIHLTVEADLYSETFHKKADGNALSFGGGKDSRLAYGVLRELDKTPQLYTTINAGAKDYEEFHINKSIALGEDITTRLIPAYMSNFKNIYYGGSLTGLVYRKPWQKYYSQGAYEATLEFSNLFKSLGIEKCFRSPTNVLPSNLIQYILHNRYPSLYKNQYSMRPGRKNSKNLQLSLCKIYHEIDFSEHLNNELFKSLLSEFVENQNNNPYFGLRGHREIVVKEMRAIIYRMQNHPLFKEVRDIIPRSWDADWIDKVHPYLQPNIDEAILDIFKEYAPVSEERV